MQCIISADLSERRACWTTDASSNPFHIIPLRIIQSLSNHQDIRSSDPTPLLACSPQPPSTSCYRGPQPE